jgi:hypothetical protein
MMKEMNGVQPFVYLASCGCVLSLAGLKALSSSSSTPPPESEKGEDKDDVTNDLKKDLSVCPQCATKYDRVEDVITLNLSPEEEERMFVAMERRRLQEPAKKSKKRKNANGDSEVQPPSKKKPLPSTNPNISVSSLAMEEAKRKAEMSAAVKSLYGDPDAPKRKETFMTMGTFTRVSLTLSSLPETVLIRCNSPVCLIVFNRRWISWWFS